MILDTKVDIGRVARQTRKDKQLGSMREIASVLGISRNDISEIERGLFGGSFDNVLKYLNYLGLSLTVQPKRLPVLDEMDGLFNDD